MLFNSIEFAIFLPLVFGGYWLIGPRKRDIQNLLLLGASYLFYGWWDWRFLSLIILSTVVDYVVACALSRTGKPRIRAGLLLLSLSVNLGLLGVFKYYNFFLDSLVSAFSFLGVEIAGRSLSVVLPVGISFYTFQTLSYTIDVYKREIDPTKDFVAFAAFVSFFPQLVAGPIERASSLLPQFLQERRFSNDAASDGLRQILWGLFKKVAIADTAAPVVNYIFDNHTDLGASTLFFGALLFAFQIYGDFSGYSDIAIGTARLFGFSLTRNFATPYFSRDLPEFWRRWHISLSSWFRDYIYLPLGGSRGSMRLQVRNILIVFLVSGLWHGANWTFIVWGALNGALVTLYAILGRNKAYAGCIASNRLFPTTRETGSLLLTFFLVTLLWVFFRAATLPEAFSYLAAMITAWDVPPAAILTDNRDLTVLIPLLVIIEYLNREGTHGLELGRLSRPARWGVYYGLIGIMFLQRNIDSGIEFIYFQF